MLYKQLQDTGLNETEAKIYLAALELGETSVGRIARKSGIKRTTVYLSLENLMERGLMSAIKKDGKTNYFAEDPRNLERIMEERKERISQLIPRLLSFANLIDKKPAIRYFEGDEGIKEVLKDALKYPGQEVCMLYSESYIRDMDSPFFDWYISQRMKLKISARAICPDNEQMRARANRDQQELRQTKLIPLNLFNIKIEIMLYGKDKMSIVSFKEKFALIIESPVIFESFKSIFETMWASNVTSTKSIKPSGGSTSIVEAEPPSPV